MIKKSEKINEIHAALKEFQKAHKHAKRDGKNPHFGSKFASLGSVREAAMLEAYGLSIVQGGMENGGVTTLVMHDSGQWIETDLPMPAIDANPQKAVANYTYGRRTAMATTLCIVGDDDDDGNYASAPEPKKPATLTGVAMLDEMITKGPNAGFSFYEVMMTNRKVIEEAADSDNPAVRDKGRAVIAAFDDYKESRR